MRDSASPIRYCVVSAISPRFVLYYHVEGNCYAMKPETATLIKSREVAEGIRLALGRDGLEVVHGEGWNGPPTHRAASSSP